MLYKFSDYQFQKQSNTAREKGFNFDDARLMQGAWRNEPNPESCKVGYLTIIRN